MKFFVKNTKKIIPAAILLLTIVLFQVVLNRLDPVRQFYNQVLFLPLQRLRSQLLNPLRFSAGDLLYLLLILVLVFLLIRIVVYFVRFRMHKNKIPQATSVFLITICSVYLLFVLLWGGNYAKPGIASKWEIADQPWNDSSILQLNEFLIQKLNETATEDMPNLHGDGQVNSICRQLYRNTLGAEYDYLFVKPASLGNALNYFGIQGYYNPLSGEGQFNAHLPEFMHPFVIAHEMAHQTGIAAEDDANLLAYIICTSATQPVLRYSAYLNLFTYAFAELKESVPQYTEVLWKQLNQKSRNDIALLKDIRQRYKGYLRGFSLSLYDQYLLWQGQEKGLNSYNAVTRWVYIWETAEKEKAGVFTCLH